MVAFPKTIDNDVGCTERSVGFDTAVNTVTDALNRLTFTAASHDRVMVVEVMGRTAGHLALQAGIAGGADVILIPEIPYSLPKVSQKLRELRDKRINLITYLHCSVGTTQISAFINIFSLPNCQKCYLKVGL